MLFERTRDIFHDDLRGIPEFIGSDLEHFNTARGPECIVIICVVPNERELDLLVESMVLMR